MFSITYIATDAALDLKVTIKEYYSKESSYRIGRISSQITWDDSGDPGIRWQDGKNSFLQEARKMARIRTIPEIVRVLDTFEENNTAYIVMDYVDGETLRDKIKREGPMSFQSAAAMLKPGINALNLIHEHGVVYCDLNPDNIMLETGGRLRLLTPSAAKGISRDALIFQNVVKLCYSPYEQRTNADTGPCSDVYSMCGVLYFCVTGRDPQDSRERTRADELIKPEDNFTPVEALVIKRGMALNKDQRIQTMSELLSAIDAAEKENEEETGSVKDGLKNLLSAKKPANQSVEPQKSPGIKGMHARKSERLRMSPEQMILQRYMEEQRRLKEKEDAEARRKQEEYERARSATKGPAVGEPVRKDEVDLYNDGLAYYNGYGVRKDYAEAVRCFRLAAEKGYAKAQNNLAICYYNGHGVKQDYSEAVKWYTLAANQGNANAQYNLGFCFSNGHGVQKNYTQAARWYALAAEQGVVSAQSKLADLYKAGRNYAEAVKWYKMAALKDDTDAQCGLGLCYYNGQGVPQDFKEAVKWYRMAAEKGNATAQLNLGLCFANGQGVKQSLAEAVNYYELAANQGNAAAQYNLGVCYGSGQGVQQSPEEAVKWYRSSAKQGFANAQCNLGFCYHYGQGVPQNFAEAVEWYRKAAEQGVAMAQYNLGVCYNSGQGVRKDYREARKWYELAAGQGVGAAEQALRKMKRAFWGF